MRIKGEVEFELSDEQVRSIEVGGIWIAAFLHDELDIVFNSIRKSEDYKVVGIQVGKVSSGTLYEE